MEIQLPNYTKVAYTQAMIPRKIESELINLAKHYPVVTVLGPRQSGKSTLVRNVFASKQYVNLELPDDRRAIEQDPRQFLDNIPNHGIIIDEVQRYPELLSYIQGFVDEKKIHGQIILTGSHQLQLHEAISQSLAGRTGILRLLPLSIQELKDANIDISDSADDFMLRGFFPKLYVSDINPSKYYQDYVSTYIERDVRKMVNVKDLGQFQDFLRLVAGRIGQLLNYDSLGNDLGISNQTVTQWISILEASYIAIKLRPYFENFGKRIIKSSKLYFTDPGLACYLLGIETAAQLARDPLRGNIYENMVVMELVKQRYNLGKEHNLYFMRDSHNNEIDVIYKQANNLVPIEIKAAKTFNPDFLKGLKYLDKIQPERVACGYLIYSGENRSNIGKFSVLNYMDCTKIFI